MSDSQRFGRRAEDLVASCLESRGWHIVARNWRFHHKELDLVAQRDGIVAFVEVKARRPGAWAHPLESITTAKRRDLRVAAQGWIASRGRPGESYRFDAAVVVQSGRRISVEVIEDAWR